MGNTITFAQVEQLRRNAKRIARQEFIKLHEALDRVAKDVGFKNWSLMMKRLPESAGETQAPPVSSSSATRFLPLRPYYLHGDPSEETPGEYYCAMCDVFALAEHFAQHDQTKSVERLLGSMSEGSREGRWRRVPGPNLFNQAVEEYKVQLAARDASRSPFHRWLVAQSERKDPVGDIAQDVESDRDFPVATEDLDALVDYLETVGASGAAVNALRAAHREYSR